MSTDGRLPEGTEHSHPHFHGPDPVEEVECVHCGGDVEDGECLQCGEPVSEAWTREDYEDAAADAAYDRDR